MRMHRYESSWNQHVTYADVLAYFSTPEKLMTIEEMQEFLNVCTASDIDALNTAILEARAHKYFGV